MPKSEVFAQKLKAIEAKLPSETRLLIVSKKRSADEIKLYYDLGHRDFGESRVQELEEKAQLLLSSCPEIRWHMIGHLQTNKINHLFSVPKLFAIHSVHDQALLEKLIKAEVKLTDPVKVFLQVNTSREEEKSGFENYETLKDACLMGLTAKKIQLAGLMTMGTLRTDDFEAEALRCFQELNSYKERLNQELDFSLHTSMGMSRDYEFALKEKSNWIRLGTMMFE